MFDHLAVPPFGFNLDPTIATFNKLRDGGKNSAYIHFYIPLIHYGGDKSWLIPATNDGSCLSKRGDLDLFFKFILNNSTENAVCVIYAIYTDVAIILSHMNWI